MKTLIFFTVYYVLTCTVFGQDRKTNVDIKAALAMKADTNKVNALNHLAWEIRYHSPDKSHELCRQGLELAKKLVFNTGIGNAYKIKGVLCDHKNDFSQAIKAYDNAIFYFQKAGDRLESAKAEINMAVLFRKVGRSREAIWKLKQALVIFREYSYSRGEYMVQSNLAISYNELRQHEKALGHIRQAYAIMKQLCIEDPDIYGNLGKTYQYLQKLDDAILNYEKAIALQDNRRSTSWMHNLGMCYQARGDFGKSLIYYTRVLASDPGIYQAIRTRRQLAELYRELGEYGKALREMDTLVAIRDSVSNFEASRQITEQQDRCDSETRRLQIAVLRKQQAIQSERIRNEERQKYLYAACGALFLFLGILLLRAFYQKEKSQRIGLGQKIEVERQKRVVELKNREILDSISYAKKLQDAIFPEGAYWKKVVGESFVLFKPKDIVAGDFYWLRQRKVVQGGKPVELMYFAVADCTGHGVPGAIVSVVCHNALNRAMSEHGILDPGEILNKTHELIMSAFRQGEEALNDGMDISLCCLNKETCELKWAGANNPLWYKNPEQPDITELRPNKQPIGSYARSEDFLTHTIQLMKGSVIYMFSDGYADQFGGPKDKKYRVRELKQQILAISHLPMEKQGQILESNFEIWRGTAEQVDDVMVIGIRIN